MSANKFKRLANNLMELVFKEESSLSEAVDKVVNDVQPSASQVRIIHFKFPKTAKVLTSSVEYDVGTAPRPERFVEEPSGEYTKVPIIVWASVGSHRSDMHVVYATILSV